MSVVPIAKGAAIRTERLSKDYGQGHGLFDLDLEVERGEVFGFLDPNGAGKSPPCACSRSPRPAELSRPCFEIREVSEESRTVFLSSHTLSEVERVTHRIAVLREG